MSVCCSVGYYGSNAYGTMEDNIKEYDLACPQVCNNGLKNFWKSRCLERIGNKEIPSCYKGCKEAAKHPELKAKMDKVIAEYNAMKKKREMRNKLTEVEINKNRYRRRIEKEKRQSLHGKGSVITKEERSKIIDMYITGFTIAESCSTLGLSKTTISPKILQ